MAQYNDGKDTQAKVLNKPEHRRSQNPLNGNSLKGEFA